jgi:hypothetical protein
MRPSPLVLLALVAVGFSLIAVPLARLTGESGAWQAPATEPSTSAEAGAAPGVSTLVRIRFAHPPLGVTVTQDGRRVATFGAPDGDAGGLLEQQATLRWPAEGPVDMLVEATWADGTPPTALGVELEPDGHETRRLTAWTEGATLTEMLTFSWK